MKKKDFNSKWISKRLGAMPSTWDKRNFREPLATLGEVLELPDEYSGLVEYGPVNPWPDQGDIGTCVGQSGSIKLEMLATRYPSSFPELVHQIVTATVDLTGFVTQDLLGYSAVDLSAGWLYEWSRSFIDPPPPPFVEGSTNLGLMKALTKIGTALESEVPTDNVAPWDGIEYDDEIKERAKRYGALEYWNINSNPNDIKKAIYTGGPGGGPTPIISAYRCRTSFRDAYNDGIVPNPSPNEGILGGHSSVLCGWKIIDGVEYYINYNSWGDDVGDGGLFYIPTDYPDFYGYDFWVIKPGRVPKRKKQRFLCFEW